MRGGVLHAGLMAAASMGATVLVVGSGSARPMGEPTPRRRVVAPPKRVRPVYVQTREIDRRLRQEARNWERQRVRALYSTRAEALRPGAGLSRRGRLVLA